MTLSDEADTDRVASIFERGRVVGLRDGAKDEQERILALLDFAINEAEKHIGASIAPTDLKRLESFRFLRSMVASGADVRLKKEPG